MPRGRTINYRGTALERFLRNCRFDPGTGCVIWTGGMTSGHGHNVKYGAFWADGRRHAAHRWAAEHIHGLNIAGVHVGHCCADRVPGLVAPNPLCVEHLEPQTLAVNRAQQTEDTRRVRQTLEQRRFWVHCQVGLCEPPPTVGRHEAFTGIPFYDPPAWLVQRELAA